MPMVNGWGRSLDSPARKGLRVHKAKQVSKAQQVSKARPVSKGHRVHLVLTVRQVPMVRGALLAQKAHKGREDSKVLMAPLDHRVQGVPAV